MLREWLQSKRQRRFRSSPEGAARPNSLRRAKFTPRLESLEDRTLLDGTLDAAFGAGGLVNTGLAYLSNNTLPAPTVVTGVQSLPNTHQNSLALQPDGRIVVAGVSAGPTTAFSVARFNADGSRDVTFGANGLVTTQFPNSSNDQANAVAIQPDGKIVVAGSTIVSGLQEFGVLRYNPNGTLDTTFGKSGFVTIPIANVNSSMTQAMAVAIQTDGRIVIAGTAENAFASTGPIIGASDTSPIEIFSPNHGLSTGQTITIANVAGNTAANGTWTITVVDPNNFTLNGSAGNGLYTGGTGGNVLGTWSGGIVTTSEFAVARIYSDGLQDSDFNGNGMTVFNVGPTISQGKVPVSKDAITSMALQPDGQIVVAGYTNTLATNDGLNIPTAAQPHTWNFAVARINVTNGLLDRSFAGGIINLDFFHALFGGRVYGLGDDMAEDVLVQPDGKIVVAGRTWMDDSSKVFPSFGVARFTTGGVLDTTLNGDGLIYTDLSPDFSDAQDVAYSVAIQGDGKIVVAGTTNRAMNGAAQANGFALVRYNLNGTEDQTFGLHGQTYSNFSTGDQATNIYMQSDGQIVVAGTINQGATFALARYSGLQSGSFQFSQPTYSVQENGAAILITITRGGGTQNTVTVAYATSDGTAKAGTNYAATSGSVTFAPGQTTATFSVPIIDDGVYQPTNILFNLTLSNPTGGGFLGFQKTATVTIVETDQPGSLEFSAGSYSVNQNGGSVTITVTRSNGSAGPVGVTYTTSNGTAVAGTDYTAATGQLSFAAGETSKTFTVQILNSGSLSSNLSFNVSLLTPTGGATLGSPNTAAVNLVNTNQPGVVQFATGSYSVAENAGSVSLTVTESSGATVPVSVTYTTSDGTAVAGTDYTASTGTITLAPGQTSATITIPVLDDGVFTVPNKGFNITLSNPTNGATLGNPVAAVVTLIEKDGTPTQLFIAQAYLDILNRPVDPSGLANWTNFLNAGGSRTAVAAGIMNSQEYRTIVVNNLFMKYLNRSADPGGLATYTAFLAAGGTDEQVAAALIGSQEYLLNRGNGNNTGFLSALYQDVLNRPIDASGLATFTQFLANGGTRTQVASILLSSTEYLTNLVQGFYQRYLRRPADSTGLNAFVTQLQSVPVSAQPLIGSDSSTIGQLVKDETVIAALVGSQEYFNLVA